MSNYAPDYNYHPQAREYNPMGDSANGYAGTVSPGALSNQAGSSPSGGGSNSNPYAEILKFLPRVSAIGQGGDPNPITPHVPNDPTSATPPAYGPSTATLPPSETTPGQNPRGGHPSAPPPTYSATNPPPRPDGTDDPAIAANWYRQFAYIDPSFGNITPNDVNAYRSNPQGMTFDKWYLAGNRAPATAGTDPNGNPIPAPTDPNSTPPAGTLPPTGTGGGTPGGFGAPTPSATPPVAPKAPDPSGYAGILKQLQDLMGGQFSYEATQLNRRLNGQAAMLGDTASGGYQEVNARANTQLEADQGNRLSGYLNTDWQSSLDRALQEYGIDKNSSTALGVAGINAGATMGAAGASAGASRYATDAALQEAMIRDRTSRYQGDQSYNLGLAGLGLDQYKFDNPSINALLGMYLQMSPEQLAQFASNPQLFPGYAYTPHP